MGKQAAMQLLLLLALFGLHSAVATRLADGKYGTKDFMFGRSEGVFGFILFDYLVNAALNYMLLSSDAVHWSFRGPCEMGHGACTNAYTSMLIEDLSTACAVVLFEHRCVLVKGQMS